MKLMQNYIEHNYINFLKNLSYKVYKPEPFTAEEIKIEAMKNLKKEESLRKEVPKKDEQKKDESRKDVVKPTKPIAPVKIRSYDDKF